MRRSTVFVLSGVWFFRYRQHQGILELIRIAGIAERGYFRKENCSLQAGSQKQVDRKELRY